jgi:hypothetical protein
MFKGTKFVKLEDIPLQEALERAARDVEVETPPPRWQRMLGFLWD